MEKNQTDRAFEPDQVSDAEKLAKVLSLVPPERKAVVTMLANAFISGMEAQAQIDTETALPKAAE